MREDSHAYTNLGIISPNTVVEDNGSMKKFVDSRMFETEVNTGVVDFIEYTIPNKKS